MTVSAAALAGLDAANYDLGGVGAGLADILRRSVTVTADNGFKPFGQADPPSTYRVTACRGEGCPPQAAASGGGRVVAALH